MSTRTNIIIPLHQLEQNIIHRTEFLKDPITRDMTQDKIYIVNLILTTNKVTIEETHIMINTKGIRR